MSEFKEETNSVFAWCSEFLEESQGSKMTTDGLYPKYTNYCDATNRIPMSDMKFFKELRRYISEEISVSTRRRIGHARKMTYENVRCKEIYVEASHAHKNSKVDRLPWHVDMDLR